MTERDLAAYASILTELRTSLRTAKETGAHDPRTSSVLVNLSLSSLEAADAHLNRIIETLLAAIPERPVEFIVGDEGDL